MIRLAVLSALMCFGVAYAEAKTGPFDCSKAVVTPKYLLELKALALAPSRLDRSGPIYIRRGDEFALPHIHPEAAGDKLRQVLLLLLDQLETIRAQHGGWVATYTGAQSPQGIFVAAAAKALGLDVLIGFGGNSVPQSLQEHILLKECADLKCRMEVLSRSGYNTVLRARLKELLARESIEAKIIKCGMSDCDSSVEMVHSVNQFIDREIANIPAGIQNIVIPAGTGNTAGLLIRAFIRNQRSFNRVVVVQNQNLDHRSTINRIIGENYPYEYAIYGNVPYQKWIELNVPLESGETLKLDGRVEAKVWEWMIKNIPVHLEPTLFWNIADTSALRGRK
jgi:1-aminocyclopropane-1-carboxylate deaminase/D-cysteine desulfhydrase-like pyridoxal-dependent ACC family enzyme